jgi:hypothetical protein
MQTNPIVLRRAAVLTAGAAIAWLIVRHCIAVMAGIDRALDIDEVEYLHSGWLLHQGLRLYRDFAEDHAPFLFVILKWMVPTAVTAGFPRLDLITYVARARIFASTLGLMGMGAVALLSYRATRSLIAPLVTIAAIMASPWVWLRGVAQIRNDPPALFLFWLGALLLLGGWRSERLRFALAGVGIGLVGVAAIWNPKWPLESFVLGVVYLAILRQAFRRGPRMVALAVLPPAVCVTAALACIAASASLGDYLFFTFRYNKLLCDWIATNPYLRKTFFRQGLDYMFCAPAFKGAWPVIAVIVSLALLCVPPIRRRLDGFDARSIWVLLALAAAATVEIRFIYPYPNIWSQYYVMWSFIAACLYGLTAAALVRLLPREGMRLAATVAIALLAVFAVEQAMPDRASIRGWPILSYLQKNLREGETVWLAVEVHPIGVRDAGYYWFANHDLVPFSLEYSSAHPGQTPLPTMTQQDLPVCRAERGLQPDLRFVAGGGFLESLPEARRCLDRLIASGRATRTIASSVWDLHPEPHK